MSKKVVSIRMPVPLARPLSHGGQEHWVHQRSTADQGAGGPHSAGWPGLPAARSGEDRVGAGLGWADGPAAIRQSRRRTWPKRILAIQASP